MKRAFLLIMIAIGMHMTLLSAQGTVVEGLSFKGDILDYPVEYAVYFPPGYETSNRSYPILYLLHGYTDDETGWIQFGEVDRIVDAGIASGEITPMIIVMPDGKETFYINDEEGKDRWSDMFIQEFIPHIEGEVRARGVKRYRAIAGLSMGGYGSLIHALKYPDMFSGCGAFSAGVWTEEQFSSFPDENYTGFWQAKFGPKEDGKLPQRWYDHSAIHLAETLPKEGIEQVRYWIDCGDDDFLTIGNAALHIAFEKREIEHEYRVREGAHNWTYWRTGLTDALSFLSDGFRQK